MLLLDWRPRIVYGTDDTELELGLPQGYWSYADETIGGRDISATGVPAAYEVRRDGLLDVQLRFYESEWAAVHAWLSWAQHSLAFDWYEDAEATPLPRSVYLHTPAMGERIAPQRDPETGVFFTLPITLRSVDGLPFATVFHADA